MRRKATPSSAHTGAPVAASAGLLFRTPVLASTAAGGGSTAGGGAGPAPVFGRWMLDPGEPATVVGVALVVVLVVVVAAASTITVPDIPTPPGAPCNLQ